MISYLIVDIFNQWMVTYVKCKDLVYYSMKVLLMILTKEWYGLLLYSIKIIYGHLKLMHGDNGNGMDLNLWIKELVDLFL